MKKCLSVILAMIIVISAFTVIPLGVSAEESNQEITEFTLEYNGEIYDLMAQDSQIINIIAYTDDNPQPMRFVIRTANDQDIDSIDIVSGTSDNKELMVAEWDDEEQCFVACGYFNEENKSYVPNSIELFFHKKQEVESIDKDWVNDKVSQELPEELQNAAVSIAIDEETKKKYTLSFADGSEIEYTYNQLTYDELITLFPEEDALAEDKNLELAPVAASDIVSTGVNDKLIKLCTKYGWRLISGYIDENSEQKKDIYTITIEDENSIIAYFYDTTMDFVAQEAITTTDSKTKDFIIEKMLGKENASTLGTMESIYIFASTEADYAVNYFTDLYSLKGIEYQITQDNSLTPIQKEQKLAAIQEYKSDRNAILMFQMFGAYFQTVSSFAMTVDPPIGIALWCTGYAMENIVPYFIEHKEYFEKAKLFIESNVPILSVIWDICKTGDKNMDDEDAVESSKYIYTSGYSVVDLTLYGGQRLHLKAVKSNPMYMYDIWISGNGYCTEIIHDQRDGSLIHSSTDDHPTWDDGPGFVNSIIPEIDLVVYNGEINAMFNTMFNGVIGYYVTGCPALPDNSIPDEDTNIKSKKYRFNGHEYQFINYADSYTNAQEWCRNNGGHLVSITSDEENIFVKQIIEDNNATQAATDLTLKTGDENYYVSVSNEGYWRKEFDFQSPVSFICEWEDSNIYMIGDVDGDSEVTVIDATYIQRYDAGFNIPISEEDILTRGDVDDDGEAGVLDATLIQRYDAGFPVAYPIGEPIA